MSNIEFEFSANAGDLLSTLEEVNTALEETDQAAEDMGDSADEGMGKKGPRAAGQMKAALGAVTVAAAATAASIYVVVKATLDLSNAANVYAKQAKQFGSTAEDIQKVEGAFDLLTDGSVNSIQAMTKLQRATAEAVDGIAEYADSFEKLGINAEEFGKLPITEQILEIHKNFHKLKTTGDQTQVTMDLLGRSGAALVPAFKSADGTILAAMQRIEDAGLISNETARQSEDLADAVQLLEQTFTALKSDTLTPLIPKLEETAEEIQRILQEARQSGDIEDFGESLAEAAVSVTELVVALAPLIGWLDTAAATFDFLVKKVQFGTRGWLKLAEAIGKAADAIKPFLTGMRGISMGGKDVTENLPNFSGVGLKANIAAGAFDVLTDALGGTGKGLKEVADLGADVLAVLGELWSVIEDVALASMSADAQIVESGERKKVALIRQTDEVLARAGLAAGDRLELEMSLADSLLAVDEQTAGDRRRLAAAEGKALSAAEQALRDARSAAIEEAREAEAEQLAEALALQEEMVLSSVAVLGEILGSVSDIFAAGNREREQAARKTADEIAAIEAKLAGTLSESERARLEEAKAIKTAQMEEAKAAAVEAFGIAQGVAVASAAVSTALAMIQGLSAGLSIGGPQGIALGVATMAAAAIAGGIAIATIAAEPAPSFEHGGLIPGQGPVPIIAHGGEEMATQEAAARNPGVVDAINAGAVLGGGSVTTVFRVGNRAVDAMVTNNLRTKRGPLSELVRATQPRRVAVGHYSPGQG